ncbi:aminoacyl-tRNA deacylase [Aestuariimicrobium sp. T2.26MG-19.2B]|uniref:aminoacyl-tRNA deacylase n=1 Tax=Aestuariimicrobium sp. T2.26MG-19.2B TaxID=3040679 RepID=UPI002477533F|nr:YbaK/EbsC family protein [Aestuariimicrobium sp. T2.26MG-19.2B]CAI9404314.1 hypothetical protein AESSP_01183 [Aestuariimicrobium sp. T2.26MG-19.2B]
MADHTPAPDSPAPDSPTPDTRAIVAARESGIPFIVTRHGRVTSVEEAAAARGIEPRDLLKTLVVRMPDDSHIFVLVPGDRQFSWPKLRALVGTNRLSMPDAATALAVTGYERGTITPFGSSQALPVYVDSSVVGRTVSLGGGGHGVGLTVAAEDVIALFDATVADLSD